MSGLRNTFGSVRVRVTALAMIVVFGSLLFGAFGLRLLLERSTLSSIRTDSQIRAAEISGLALQSQLPVPLASPIGTRPTLLQVIESDGTVSTGTPPLDRRSPLLSVQQLDGDRGHKQKITIDNSETSWWVEAVPATLSGRRSTVIVVTSLDELERTLRRLVLLLAIGIPALSAGACFLVWSLVGRALDPVERLRAEVETLAGDSRKRDQRVGVPETNDEISRLAQTLNILLTQLDTSAYVQRRFVADASHELRGPITNIRLAVEVAQAHPDKTDWADLSTEVLTQSDRMGRLVEHLLLLARTDDDQVLRRREPVDLSEIVAQSVKMNSRARVPVRFTRPTPVLMFDDRSQLTSIVNNLVENAIRFASKQVTLTIVSSGGWAEIAVRDDGPGVPENDRERIFDRFYRVDAHRSREGGGTGLGLAIVARLVSERGGTVTVADSAPGALFVVRIPLSAIT